MLCPWPLTQHSTGHIISPHTHAHNSSCIQMCLATKACKLLVSNLSHAPHSVWALAHNECKLALAIDEKALPNCNTYGPKTRNFLNATANGANELLHQLRAHRTSNGCAALLAQAEHQFSGQASGKHKRFFCNPRN